MYYHWHLLLLATPSILALPALDHSWNITRDRLFEWTALGDSFASGVGSGNYVDGRRCLRYDGAYPVIMNKDTTTFPSGDHVFNNVVCSGSSSRDIEAYQFYLEDTSGQPNIQYGELQI